MTLFKILLKVLNSILGFNEDINKSYKFEIKDYCLAVIFHDVYLLMIVKLLIDKIRCTLWIIKVYLVVRNLNVLFNNYFGLLKPCHINILIGVCDTFCHVGDDF